MNLNLSSLWLVLFAVCFISCNSSHSKEDELLDEAAKIHNEAVQIEQQIKDKITTLNQQANNLKVQGRELEANEISFIEQVNNLNASYNYWQENHVEVPGHDDHDHHGHDHGHDHDHDHGPALEISPEDMLLIQKEFKDSILSIKNRVETIAL